MYKQQNYNIDELKINMSSIHIYTHKLIGICFVVGILILEGAKVYILYRHIHQVNCKVMVILMSYIYVFIYSNIEM